LSNTNKGDPNLLTNSSFMLRVYPPFNIIIIFILYFIILGTDKLKIFSPKIKLIPTAVVTFSLLMVKPLQ